MSVGDRTIGALNLYAHEPAAFRGAARRHAEAFAVQCGAALTVALRQSDAAEASQHRNHKLREVAAELVTKVSGGPPQPPAPFHAVSRWLEDA